MKTLVCNCTLPYTNPNACKNCSEWIRAQHENDNFDNYNDLTVDWKPNKKLITVKKTTKTIEKYGPQGEYLGKEVITEEVEHHEKEVYDYDIIDIDDNGTGTFPIYDNTTNGDDYTRMSFTTGPDNNSQISFSTNVCIN